MVRASITSYAASLDTNVMAAFPFTIECASMMKVLRSLAGTRR